MQRSCKKTAQIGQRSSCVNSLLKRRRRAVRAAIEGLEPRWMLSANTSAIVADSFTNAGGPFGTTAYANGRIHHHRHQPTRHR